VRFGIHAGALYSGYGLAESLRAAGATITIPIVGKGIGQQLRYYAEH
jgi:hypothetical protein